MQIRVKRKKPTCQVAAILSAPSYPMVRTTRPLNVFTCLVCSAIRPHFFKSPRLRKCLPSSIRLLHPSHLSFGFLVPFGVTKTADPPQPHSKWFERLAGSRTKFPNSPFYRMLQPVQSARIDYPANALLLKQLGSTSIEIQKWTENVPTSETL